MIRSTTLCGLVFATLSPFGVAQELLWERVGVPSLTHFAGQIQVLGDINNDGWADLMHQVGVVVNPPACNQEYQLWTLSGKDGSTLRTRPTIGPKRPFMAFAAAGDVDGDGRPDYATSIFDQSFRARDIIVEVRSAVDDRLIWQVTDKWGTALGLALLGDLHLDGDKRPDLVVTAPRATRYGEVRAYSSKGSLLYRLPGTQKLAIGMWEGQGTLGKVGDVDGDGADDFVVGGLKQTTSGYAGAVVLISGKAGKVLHVGVGARSSDSLGHSVAGVGDIDGDGVPDFAGGTSANSGGIVMVFSGKTGKPIWTWRGKYPRSNWGDAVAGSGVDVDRDGVPDVIAGAPLTGEFNPRPTAAVYLMSGRDGQVISSMYPASAQSTYLGCYVAMIPAQPGSPFPLFAVSEPGYGQAPFCLPNQGRLLVYRGSPAGVSVFGVSCRGTLATFPKAGVRDLGARGARFTVYDAAPSAPAVLMVGLSRNTWGSIRLPLALYHWGYPGCLLFTSVEVALVAKTDSTGFASLDLPVSLMKTGKLTLFSQWLSMGTGTTAPGGVSDALMWRAK